jgi:hypothetical protein
VPNTAYPTAVDLTPDGVNTIFTLPSQPDPASLLVLWNGQVQRGDYTISGSTLSLTGWVPQASDSLTVYYTSAGVSPPFSGGPGGISFDPEVIANALFIRLGQTSYPFKAMDRRGKIWANVNASDQPYLALIERGGTGVQNEAIGLQKWTLHFLVLVYIQADANPSTIPATAINAAFKAIASIMNSSPMGERQTLGGIVNNAWINGEVMIDTGILDQQCALLIPVDVETGL